MRERRRGSFDRAQQGLGPPIFPDHDGGIASRGEGRVVTGDPNLPSSRRQIEGASTNDAQQQQRQHRRSVWKLSRAVPLLD